MTLDDIADGLPTFTDEQDDDVSGDRLADHDLDDNRDIREEYDGGL